MIRIARWSRWIALGSLVLLVISTIAAGALKAGNHQASQTSAAPPPVQQPAPTVRR
jgi:hypothetical protein